MMRKQKNKNPRGNQVSLISLKIHPLLIIQSMKLSRFCTILTLHLNPLLIHSSSLPPQATSLNLCPQQAQPLQSMVFSTSRSLISLKFPNPIWSAAPAMDQIAIKKHKPKTMSNFSLGQTSIPLQLYLIKALLNNFLKNYLLWHRLNLSQSHLKKRRHLLKNCKRIN